METLKKKFRNVWDFFQTEFSRYTYNDCSKSNANKHTGWGMTKWQHIGLNADNNI